MTDHLPAWRAQRWTREGKALGAKGPFVGGGAAGRGWTQSGRYPPSPAMGTGCPGVWATAAATAHLPAAPNQEARNGDLRGTCPASQNDTHGTSRRAGRTAARVRAGRTATTRDDIQGRWE